MRVGLVFGLMVSLAACGGTPADRAPHSPPTTVVASPDPSSNATAAPLGTTKGAPAVDEVPRSPPSPRVVQTLRDAAVYRDAAARKVLYTWTAWCHLDHMRKHKRLLYRTDLPGPYGSSVAERLRLRPKDAVAQLLSRPEFRYRRPAWSTTWGARLPEVRERGEVIVRVELRDDAIIAVLDSELKGGWRFVAVDGAPIARADVLRNPRKVAAIHEVWRGDDAEAEPIDQSNLPFRQYLLINESMVASTDVNTPELKTTVSRDIQFLEAMARWIEGLNEGEPPFEPWKRAVVAAWREPSDDEALTLWNAAVPAIDEDYLPASERIDGLRADLLRHATFSEPELQLRQRVPFGAKAVTPKPRRVKWDPSVFTRRCAD